MGAPFTAMKAPNDAFSRLWDKLGIPLYFIILDFFNQEKNDFIFKIYNDSFFK
jgi:hypothetical protein